MFNGLELRDMVKAFPAVDYDILHHTLHHYNIKKTIFNNFVWSFLKNQTQFVFIANKNKNFFHKYNNIDMPQVSTMGLLILFLLF